MIDISVIESKAYSMGSMKDIKPHYLNKLLEPNAREEEIQSLITSIGKTNFTNKNDPILLVKVNDKYKILDGKNRFFALKKLTASKVYCKIIPQESSNEDIRELILMKIQRRDKTKTQKAIGAFRYYIEFRHKENLTIPYIASQFGCSQRVVNDCMTLSKLGREDILNDLFEGKRFSYETTDSDGNIITKATTSVSVAVAVLKTTQKSIEPKDNRHESENFTIENIPIKQLLVTAIQKTKDKEIIELIKKAYAKIGEDNNGR